jgi:hypothetical protein
MDGSLLAALLATLALIVVLLVAIIVRVELEARRSRGLELAVVLLIAIELGTALYGLVTGG